VGGKIIDACNVIYIIGVITKTLVEVCNLEGGISITHLSLASYTASATL